MKEPAKYPLWGIMQHQGRSGRWLARVTGFSASYVSLIATGRRPAPDDFRRSAALALGLPEDTLFGTEETPLPHTITEAGEGGEERQ